MRCPKCGEYTDGKGKWNKAEFIYDKDGTLEDAEARLRKPDSSKRTVADRILSAVFLAVIISVVTSAVVLLLMQLIR